MTAQRAKSSSVFPGVPISGVLALALASLAGPSCGTILGLEDTRVDDNGPPVCTAPLVACNDTCVDVTSDPGNCGACGHDCGDGLCSDRACQPVTIASQIDAPYAMAVTPSGDQVFWLTPLEVRRCPISGCTQPARIAEFSPAFTPVQKRNRIVATDQEIFWIGKTATDVLMSCPAAGCSMLIPGVKTGHELDSPRALTLVGQVLVVGQRFEGLECQLAGGCARVSCISADSIQSATIDASRIFWLETTDPAGLYSCPRQGPGTPFRLTADSGQVVRLLGDDLYVLRQAGDSIYRCARDGCSGAGTPVVMNEQGAGSMAVDPGGVYFTVRGSDTEATGAVKMCPVAGCGPDGPRVLAAGQAQPTDVTLSGPDVLWINQGLTGVPSSGALMRVRR